MKKFWSSKKAIFVIYPAFLLGLVLVSSSLARADNSTLAQRLDQRKSNFHKTLDAAAKQQIVSHCALAQGAIANVKGQDTASFGKRSDVYTDLQQQLSSVTDRLDKQAVNDQLLKTAQSQFVAAISLFNNDANSYKTAIDDLIVMNCAQDPIGFAATLDQARSLRSQLISDGNAIKNLLPTLQKDLASAKQTLSGGSH